MLFAATPHGVSMEQIDAFRRPPAQSSTSRRTSVSRARHSTTSGTTDTRPKSRTERVRAAGTQPRQPRRRETHRLRRMQRDGDYPRSKPLFDADVLTGDEQVVVDVKVGSCEGGAGGGDASSHPERSGIVRPYAPIGHRHEAEIEQFLGVSVSFTVHAVDMVRGASATCHVFPESPVSKGDLWKAYRGTYADEPFVRTVAGGGGVYRYPEPKSVAGTNMAEVGFELDPSNRRVVVFSAIDNMMKGSAGQAVHAANVALGLEETAGLEFTGLHPVGAP